MVLSHHLCKNRLLERIFGWPVGDGTCWVSVGGDRKFTLGDLGSIVGLCDGAGQS